MICTITFQQLQGYASFAADLATVLGGISVFIGICALLKNHLNRNSLRLKINVIRSYSDDTYFFLSIQNFTDNFLYIIEIELLTKKQRYQAKELYLRHEVFLTYRPLKNIPVSSFEADDFGCYFEIKKSELPKILKFKITTTQKTFIYKIENPLLAPKPENNTTDSNTNEK